MDKYSREQLLEVLNLPIARVRAQILTSRVLYGLAWLVFVSVACAAGTLLFDWATPLPAAMRLVLTLASFAGIVYVFWRHMLRPLSERISADRAALAIETRYPELRTALISAIQLARRRQDEGFFNSDELVDLAVRDAAKQVYNMRIRGVVDWLKPVRVWVLAAACMFAAGLYVRAHPDTVRLWFQRFFAPFNAPSWPKMYRLKVKKPSGQRTRVAKGDSVEVVVESMGPRHPDTVRIYLKTRKQASGAATTADVKRPWEPYWEVGSMECVGGTRFRKKFENLVDDMKFYVEGGDDRTAEYVIEVKEPPFVEKIRLHMKYPAYLRKPDKVVEQGSVRVEEGTEIEFEVTASTRLKRAEFWMDNQRIREYSGAELGADSRTLRGVIKAFRTRRYWFFFEDAEGFNNRRSAERFTVHVIHDHPPSIKFIKPGRSMRMSENAVLPMHISIRDDNGVLEAALHYFKRKETERTATPQSVQKKVFTEREMKYTDGESKARAEVKFDFDIAKLTGAHPGEEVVYHATAKDACTTRAKQGESFQFVITIVRKEDLEAEYRRIILRVRDRLKRVLTKQRLLRDAMRTLGDDLIDKTRAPDAAARRELAAGEGDQRDITSSLRLSQEDVRRVIEGMTLNKTGTEVMLKLLSQAEKTLDRLGNNDSPEIARRINGLNSNLTKADLSAEFDAICGDMDLLADSVKALLDQLFQYATIAEFISYVREIKKSQGDIWRQIERMLKGEPEKK